MTALEEFKDETLHLEPDYEGKVIATLVHSPENMAGRPAVLYLHGFNDYFFQTHIADQFHRQGYNFYALDLRKYGRSLLPHQHPNYCRSLTEYFEEIDKSLNIISSEKPASIALLGHSTGGLIASLYLNTGEYRKKVGHLILNSPFLQFNMPKWKRILLKPFAAVISGIFPYASQKKALSHLYGESIQQEQKGEWAYNKIWKPTLGFPAYFKWVYAVFRVQDKLKRDSHIDVPILILHSDESSHSSTWDDELLTTDMVLDVEHIKKYGRNLGDDITFEEVPNAMHDVFLSRAPVRAKAFDKMFSWLHKN